MDYYTFCSIDMDEMILHIIGVMRFTEFWDHKSRFSETTPYPCNYVEAHEVSPWEPYVRGVPSTPRKFFDYKKEGWKKSDWR